LEVFNPNPNQLKSYNLSLFLLIVSLLVGCKSYKADYMFRTDQEFDPALVQKAISEAESNYRIQSGDLLSVEVYTNKGELLIDPNFELLKDSRGNLQENRLNPDYLVQEDGIVKLPIVGLIDLHGLTLHEAEEILEKEYSNYYKDVFVIAKYTNKRVIVMGGTGGQVIPLTNEKTSLIEVLALAGGINKDSKAYNIRLVRGDLNNPTVFLIDLSTVEGSKASVVPLQPNDIIYVEPVRRVFLDALRDLTPVIALITTTITLIVLILNV